nr:beta-adaptin-like protein B [Tanacetum cinerariifolium]
MECATFLEVPQVQPGSSKRTLLPMVLFQNIAPGPSNSLLHIAIKNNQQPVWYFNDKISLLVLFMEDGRMERATFLETWKSIPDSNEVSRDIPAKIPKGIPYLIELTAVIGVPVIVILGLKCALKTPSPEMAPLLFEAL